MHAVLWVYLNTNKEKNKEKKNKTQRDTDFIIWHLPKTHAGHLQSPKLYCQHTDFATELMELLVALIDCCPPRRQMLKGDVTPQFGRWLCSRAVTFRDLGHKISAQICSYSARECAISGQTHVVATTLKPVFFCH